MTELTLVFWKSVIRRKGSLLVLLALIGTASFGFLLRGVEYLAVSQKIDEISQSYRMIGTLSSTDYYVTDAIPLVEESPYVDYTNVTRHCSAILADIYNADVDGRFSHNNRVGFELRSSDVLVWARLDKKKETNEPGVYQCDFRVEESVYGYPEYTYPNRLIRVNWESAWMEASVGVELEEDHTYLIKAYYDSELSSCFGEGLYFCLQELADGVWFVEGEPDEEMARQYMDEDALLQDRNRHTMVALATTDMSATFHTQEASRMYYLEEGRWLNLQDHEEGRKVCVINKDFADIRGLQLGDTIKMTVMDAYLLYWGYVTSLDEDPWESKEKITEEFEIVGIYGDLNGGEVNSQGYFWLSANSNYLYIPNSSIPDSYLEGIPIDQSYFTFTLTSPEYRDAFLQEMEEPLASLGYTISFFENNWDSFSATAETIRRETFYGFLIFAVVLIVALGAVTFLYTWQRKKEIAIARALGVPSYRAALGASLPMLFWGLAGILVGGSAAWKHGLAQAEETLAALGGETAVTLSLSWLVKGCLLVWLLLILAVLSSAGVYAHKSVLESLHGSKAPGRRKNKARETYKLSEQSVSKERMGIYEEGKTAEKTFGSVSGKGAAEKETDGKGAAPQPPSRRRISVLAEVRFIGRHLCRFSLRSFFGLLAAAVFVTASCWLRHSILAGEQEVDRLYRTTEVTAEISRKDAWSDAAISSWTIQSLMDTGFIQDCYLEAKLECHIGQEDRRETRRTIPLLGTSDLKQFLSYSWNDYTIQYVPGYGEELFEEDYEQVDCCTVILPEDLWNEWKLSGGEKIELLKVDEWTGRVKYSIPVMVGGFWTGTGDPVVLTPMSLVKWMNGDYTTVQFTLDPEQNRKMDEFRDVSDQVMEKTGAKEQRLALQLRDSELRQTVEPMEKNITLMKILYPIANAVSVLAAIGLSILFLFQRRREAAILRVLGVTRSKTRLILILELLLVNVAGMLLGAGLTALLTGSGGVAAMPLALGCYFTGCLMGTIAGAVWVTNGGPLELLQES